MEREKIYGIYTVKELDDWVNDHGLSYDTDTELSLRRVALLADELLRKNNHCAVCNKPFKQRSHLLRHERSIHGNTNIKCAFCPSTFNRQDHLNRHLRSHKENKMPIETTTSTVSSTPTDASSTLNSNSILTENRKRALQEHQYAPESKRRDVHNNAPQKCIWCSQIKTLLPGKKFCSACGDLGRECNWCHRPLPERFYGRRTDVCERCLSRREKWQTNRNQQTGGARNALDNTARIETLDPAFANQYDVLQFFKDNETIIDNLLTDRLRNLKGIKWFITLFVKFVKYNQNTNETIFAEPVFRSSTFGLTNVSQIEEQTAEAFQNVHNSYQNFEREGSGWAIDKILKLEINTVEYVPLQGSSYIPLPKKIVDKKAVLNIKNEDQKCFIWSILAALFPISRQDHPDRVSHYKQFENKLNLAGIDYPVSVSQISNFEKNNDISVSLFALEGSEVYPLQITNNRTMTRHVNLLLFSKGEKRHFCLIRNLSRLLGDRTLHKSRIHYCNYCLHGFSTNDLLQEHVPYCSPHGPQKVSFPKSEDNQWVYFNSIQKQLRAPFVIYADFESFVKPLHSCEPSPTESSTTAFQKHEPCGFSYMIKCTNDELSKPPVVYRGSNIIETFFDNLIKEEENICEILSNVKPMKLSNYEETAFQETVECHICNKPLGADRVRDHDHLSGKFRGAAHSNCNLQFQFRQGKHSKTSSKFYIPVIFHNLKSYDMHLLMESVGLYKNRAISVIPNNMEKYLSFSFGNLKFIDSLQFLNASLETLVDNLATGESKMFPNLTKHFPNTDHQKLLIRKGVYCYSYVTSPDSFKEKSLPSKSYFYNDLNECDLSDEDYEHAKRVWQTFDMKCLGDFHDLYIKSDVILLADVFENFRSISMKHYDLDPVHYYSSPGFSWDAMLKKTGARLQLLDDISMVNMIESGVRGGISMINKKFAQANNPEVEEYDCTKPKTWLTYLDMNNLYGTAMCDPLPEKDFVWLTEQELQALNIITVADNAHTGYILDVDLDIPNHLHNELNDYPLAPESMAITDDMLSEFNRNLKDSLGIKGKPSKKLVPTLLPKRNYVLHYRNLKYYLSKGIHIKKVNRAISFTQSCWLKPYVLFNTELRRNSQNNFEKDLFKLYNNSIFGKTIENMRKRVSVELVHTPKRLRKICAKPNFQSFKIFNEDLVGVHLKKVNIVLNRPMYAGFCILDISKVYMYKFHYDFIQKMYGSKAELLFTDTDSLAYEIETENWYDDLLRHHALFDTSNFPKTHPLYSSKNCKVLGKMKDECGGNVISQFVGLRPKMYSLQYGGVESRKAKGIKKCVIEKQLKHAMYVNCLEKQTSMRHSMNLIRSFDHQLFSIRVNKVSLSPFDNKRYFTGITSLAYGHNDIVRQTNE